MEQKRFNINGVINGVNEFNKLINNNQKQNIMKKSFLFLAVAASFAACTSNDQINDDLQGDEIRFDQVLNKTTKAEITNEAALASAGGFAVFGYKSTDGFERNETTVFNGDNVKLVDGVWKYDNTRYWDKTTTYNFYAIAPYEAVPNYSLTDGMFVINNVVSGLAADSKDYVIDRTFNDESGIAGNGTHSKIGFEFHHVMAKVSFAVKTTIADATIIVQNLTMTGWDAGKGKFTQSKTDGTWRELNVSEWNIAVPLAGSATLIGDGSGNADEITLSSTAQDLTDVYIMVPQEIAAETLTFTVDYTINGEPFTNQVSALAAAQTWGTDSYTKYTLAIGPSAIEFDVETVCDFCYTAPEQTPNVQ